VTVKGAVLSSPVVEMFTAVNAVGAAFETDEMASAALTVSDSANVTLPPAFVAVTVYVVCATAAVGVPEITPLVVLSDNPDGNAGLTE
jgi:hypothetical protein